MTEHDGVARFHEHLLVAGNAAPAGSRRQDVIGDQMLRTGMDARNELPCLDGEDRTRVRGFYSIEVGAREPNGSQNIR